MNPFDVLQERGFIFQVTDEQAIGKLFDKKRVTAYIGFDPTADSLHAGSLVPIMSLAHLQRNGHRPIGLVGGGTGLVGDPSGRTQTRKLLSIDDVHINGEALKRQLEHFISFDEGRALLLNNADWLVDLNYIEFLRDVGKHISVNRMLSAESVKQRLEKGLTFIEFNYMVLQAYDFYILNHDYDCDLQMGGQDQWGNIVAGIDLTRRISGKETFGVTFPLITNSAGDKFGKSVKGAVWLDAAKTSPYDYYQFFRNTIDSDVGRYLGLFTFLPMKEVHALASLKPPLLNRAKEILAFEATMINHDEEEAKKAFRASTEKFGEADPGLIVETSSSIIRASEGAAESPSASIGHSELDKGFTIVDAFLTAGLVSSKSEGRRLVRQGGAYVEGRRVDDENEILSERDFKEGGLDLRAGRKRHMRLVLEP
jgi:tyrosyl-tRNA synthetase